MHNRSIRLPLLLNAFLLYGTSVFLLDKIFLSNDLELKWGVQEERRNSEVHIFLRYSSV